MTARADARRVLYSCFLDRPQKQALDRLAERTRIAAAVFVREALDDLFAKYAAAPGATHAHVAPAAAAAMAGATLSPADQQRSRAAPLKVGDRLYLVYSKITELDFKRGTLKRDPPRVIEGTVLRLGKSTAFVGYRIDDRRRDEARVSLREINEAGAARDASDQVWMRDRGDDPRAAGLRIIAYRRAERAGRPGKRAAKIAALRRTLQREHPDKGGDAELFSKAKRELDRMKRRAR